VASASKESGCFMGGTQMPLRAETGKAEAAKLRDAELAKQWPKEMQAEAEKIGRPKKNYRKR